MPFATPRTHQGGDMFLSTSLRKSQICSPNGYGSPETAGKCSSPGKKYQDMVGFQQGQPPAALSVPRTAEERRDAVHLTTETSRCLEDVAASGNPT